MSHYEQLKIGLPEESSKVVASRPNEISTKTHNRPASRYLFLMLVRKDNLFLFETKNIRGKKIFKLFNEKNAVLGYFYPHQVRALKMLFKKDRNNKITLNLTKVRQLHGNNIYKRDYKRHRNHGNNK